jgi:serine protease SohB
MKFHALTQLATGPASHPSGGSLGVQHALSVVLHDLASTGQWLLHNLFVIVLLLSVVLSYVGRRHQSQQRHVAGGRSGFLPGTVVVTDLGTRIRNLNAGLRKQIEDPAPPDRWAVLRVLWRIVWPAPRQSKKSTGKESSPRAFVVDYSGGRDASIEPLRQVVNGILAMGRAGDKVLIRLTSPGGYAHSYGLAAAQVERLRAAELHVTVAVDLVAASGGYWVASVANRIVAAPQAVIGSIGAVIEIPNIHRLLERLGIDWTQIAVGDHKRSITMTGKQTEEGTDHAREKLEAVLARFKAAVKLRRPQVDIDAVATGDVWAAAEAVELGLVDELATSDDVLLALVNAGGKVFEVAYRPPMTRVQRMLQSSEAASARWIAAGLRRLLTDELDGTRV